MDQRHESDGFRYWAFISYSHSDEQLRFPFSLPGLRWLLKGFSWSSQLTGAWLHAKLETFVIPSKFVGYDEQIGRVPKRLSPIFLDQEELPTSSDLGANIRNALAESRFLIVVASPNAAQSRWVDEEIRAFKRLGREDAILPFIIAGEPNASDKPGMEHQECFPPSLRFRVGGDGQLTDERVEPIGADNRPEFKGKTNPLLKLIAGMANIPYAELYDREEKRRRRRLLVRSLLVLLVFAGGLAVWATQEYRNYLSQEAAHRAELSARAERLNLESRNALFDRKEVTEALFLARDSLRIAPSSDPGIPAYTLWLQRLAARYPRHRFPHELDADSYGARPTLSPDGHLIATVSNETAAQLWDLSKQSPLSQQFVHDAEVYPAMFNPDSTQLLTLTMDGMLRQWAVASGEMMLEPIMNGNTVTAAAISPDGNWFYSGMETGEIQRINLETGRPTYGSIEHPGFVNVAAMSPDGKLVATGGGDELTDSEKGVAIQWLSEQHELSATLHESPLTALAYSPDGRWLATGTQDGICRLWHAGSDKPRRGFMGLDDNDINWITMSEDGSKYATAHEEGDVIVWDANTGHTITKLANHPDSVTKVEFSADGLRLLTVCEDGQIRTFDAESGDPGQYAMRHSDWINFAVFSSDGRLVLTGSEDGTAQVWEAATGKPVSDPLEHYSDNNRYGKNAPASVDSGMFNQDGSRVLTIVDDSVWVWNLTTGHQLHLPIEADGSIRTIALSPSDDRLMVASDGYSASAGSGSISFGVVEQFDTRTGSPIGNTIIHPEGINMAAYSPDGATIVTVGDDGTTRIWDRENERLLDGIKHQSNPIWAVFSRDGQRLVTVTIENQLRVWDAKTAEAISPLFSFENDFLWASISEDGTLVACVTGDHVSVWEVGTGKVLESQTPLFDFADPDWEGQWAWKWALTTEGQNSNWIVDASAVHPILDGGSISPRSAHFTNERQWLLTPHSDVFVYEDEATALIWDASRGRPLYVPMLVNDDSFTGPVGSASFSPDGTSVLARWNDAITILDAQTGVPLGKPMTVESDPKFAMFSPDGRIIASVSDGNLQFWDAATREPLSDVLEHQSSVNWMAFSPDGKYLVTASDNAHIWDVSSYSRVHTLPHDSSLEFAQFSFDSTRMLTVSDDLVRVWKMDANPDLTLTIAHERNVDAAAFTTDGNRILTSSDQITLAWDAATGERIGEPLTIDDTDHNVSTIVIPYDDEPFVLTAVDDVVFPWDLDTLTPRWRPMLHDFWINSIDFSPDSRWIVAASNDGMARVWDSETGMPISRPMTVCEGYSDEVIAAVFSPDGRYVATACDNGTAKIWNPATGDLVSSPLTSEDADSIDSIRFSPDSKWIVIAGETDSFGDTASIYEVESGALIAEGFSHDDEVYYAEVSPDGRFIVTASADETARIWDINTGDLICDPLQHNEYAEVSHAIFSPDGKWVATAADDGEVRVWKIANGQPEGPVMALFDEVVSLQYSDDGAWLFAITVKGRGFVVDTKTGDPRMNKMGHGSEITALACSPDGAWLVSGADSGRAKVWETTTGKERYATRWNQESRDILDVSFSGDSSLVAIASEDWESGEKGVIEVFDFVRGRVVGQPLVFDTLVNSVSFHPNKRRIVTSSDDGVAEVWDIDTGTPVGKAMRHDGLVLEARYDRTGTMIVTASDDKSARIWDANSGDPLSWPMNHSGEVYSASFSADGKWVITWDGEMAYAWAIPILTQELASSIQHAEFSPDGQRVLMKELSGSVWFWDWRQNTKQRVAEQSQGTPSISLDGKWIIVTDTNAEIQYYDVATLQLQTRPPASLERAGINSEPSGADGGRFGMRDDDGPQLWNLQSDHPVSEALTFGRPTEKYRFSPDQRWLLVWDDNVIRMSPIGASIKSVESWMLSMPEALSGMRMSSDRVLEPIPAQDHDRILEKFFTDLHDAGNNGDLAAQAVIRLLEPQYLQPKR